MDKEWQGIPGWGIAWKAEKHERMGHIEEIASVLICGRGCLWATVGERSADSRAIGFMDPA